MQPSFGGAPFALNRNRGQLQNLSNLLNRKPSEKLKLNDLAFSGVERSQPIERLVEGNEFRRALLIYQGCFIELNVLRSRAAFGKVSPARVIDQDVAHYLRSHRKEVRPIIPCSVLPTYQPQIRFIYQSGSLQSVSRILSAHVLPRDPVQFGVNELRELIERLSVAFLPSH
jgi:hypothetical protein